MISHTRDSKNAPGPNTHVMRSFLVCCVALPLSVLALEPESQLELLWEAEGLAAPESVIFDAQREQYYVSNMGTYGEGAVQGDGFISRLDKTGAVLELRWATGLENPKGLALSGDRLFVGDDHALVEISLASGRVINTHAPEEGPGDFNDCTVDREGNVYVYSASRSAVFRLHRGQLQRWADLDRSQVGGINGLLAEDSRLLLGGWSVRTPGGAEQLGHLSFVTFAERKMGRLGTRPICHIDGIQSDGAGGYTVTDWLTGELFHVTAAGESKLLLRLSQGTADHAYLPGPGLFILPLMKENRVAAYRWKASPRH